MATKRGGSELNHDNWDQEDEPEEQGTFKKASENELKQRVIKKPKRRNAGTEGETKNAFAGFGGFASAAKPTSGAFEFLKKSGDDSSNSSSSQVFGTSGNGNKDSAKPSFVFGSSSLSKSAETTETSSTKSSFAFGSGSSAKPAASTFSFGAGAAPAAKATFSFTSTASDEKKDAAPSGFGAAFGSVSSNEKKDTPTTGFKFGSASADDKKDSPSSGFGSAFGSFAPKPAEEKKEDTGHECKVDEELMEKFKPKGWSCEVCMVANDTSKDKCVSCETPKPGSKPVASQPTEKPVMSFGKEGGFSFQATSSQTPAAGSGFTFGETKGQDKPPAGGGFTFGEKAEGADGADATPAKTATESNKSCGTQNKDYKDYLSHLKALNIQVTNWIKKHVDERPLVILTPVFKDYEKHLKSITEKYKVPPPKPTSQPEPSHASQPEPSLASQPEPSLGSTAFGAKADDDLMAKFGPKHGDWSCDVCMVSNAKDRDKCLSCETPKPGSKPKENAATSTFSLGKSGGFTFAADKESSSEPAKSGFSFASAGNAEKPTTGGFSFTPSTNSNPPATTGGFSFAPKTGDAPKPFSFNASSPFSFSKSSTAPTAAKTEEEDDEEDKPPVVEVKAVTEVDAVYSKKCKLFYKKDGAYVEKGVGMLHLKPTENDKTQLLIRADTNLGNILLNILLTPQIPTTRVGKNNVMLVCVPNPPLEAKTDEASGPTPMLIRVKNAEDADELKAKVDELKEK